MIFTTETRRHRERLNISYFKLQLKNKGKKLFTAEPAESAEKKNKKKEICHRLTQKERFINHRVHRESQHKLL